MTVRAEGDSPVGKDLAAAVTTRLAVAGLRPAEQGERSLVVRVEHSTSEEIREGFHAYTLSAAARVQDQAEGAIAQTKGFGRTAAEAALQANSKAAERLVGDLLAHSATGFERKIRITVDGLTDLSAHRRTAAKLRALRWVVAFEPDQVGLRGGRGVWVVRSQQPGGVLAARLDREPDLEVVSFDLDHVELRAKAR